MNKQKASGIGYCDFTWNPVTGCKQGCSYCYARMIVTNRIVHNPRLEKAFPKGFEPTFHPERLSQPKKVKKPSRIFVVDMGDLFGEWVPYEWIVKVLDACKEAPQHTYLFLTKNPERMVSFDNLMPPKAWLGTSIESQDKYDERSESMWDLDGMTNFASFEPLLSPIKLDMTFDWIIIGERTGKAMTQEEIHQVSQWAKELIDQAKILNIPVFVKNALGAIYPQREFPR